MKQRFALSSIFLAAFSLFTSATANAQDAWTNNYEDALKRAKENGKDMLLVFTASEWVKICQVFDRDILQHPDFITPMSEKYELVKLEYPRAEDQPINLKVQNDLLKRAYRITGYPIVIATDTDGRPFGLNGYQPVTPGEYAKVMLSMQETRKQRDEKFAAAAAATNDLEKAEQLAAGIPDLPGNLTGRYYGDQLRTVIKGDPENKTGKTEVFKRMLADVSYARQMEALRKDVQWSKMLKLTDAYITQLGLQGVERQRALMNKYGVQQKINDLPGSIATLLEVAKIDPKSPQGVKAQQLLDQLRAQKLQEDLVK